MTADQVLILDLAAKDQPRGMHYLPNMLMAGAAGRNLGKTELLCRLIREQSALRAVTAIKITTLDDAAKPYRQIEGNFDVMRDVPGADDKDTHRMYAAGATTVYWLRAKRPHLQEGIHALLNQMSADGVDLHNECLICESAGARHFIEPGLFFIVKDPSGAMKPAAQQVQQMADRCLVDLSLSVHFQDGQWILPETATAIILSGGSSRRMGEDKALMQLNENPAIQSLADHLAPHFSQLLISGAPEKYSFTGYEVIEDLEPDQGPLMGLLSALKHSRHELNVVTTCDVPDVHMPFVRRMLREIETFDAVMPRINTQEQPLFAVYRRSIVPHIEKLLCEKRRAVHALLDCIKVHMIDLDADWYFNLNTQQDVQRYKKNQK